MATLAPRLSSKAPEKGVFPLDHFGECKHVADQYLMCLHNNNGDAAQCVEFSKLYLRCRMDRNLMVRQELSELGLADNDREHKDKASTAGGSGNQTETLAAPPKPAR